MDVHIATVGTTKEPIVDGIRCYPTRPDKVYLICTNGSKRVALEIQKILSQSLPDLEVEITPEVDEYSLEEILDALMSVVRKERGNSIYINITGGTKVMAGAALMCAYLAGTYAYYLPDGSGKPKERIYSLPIPSFQLKDFSGIKTRKYF